MYHKCRSFIHTNRKPIQVVNEGSARLNKSNETVVGLNANHLTMCKFPSRSSSLYSKVLRRLNAAITAIGTAVGEDESELRRRLESVPDIPASGSLEGLT
jgi:hypothetical protein